MRRARPPFFYGWVLVVALGITTIVSYGTTQYLFGVLVLPIGQELGWSRGLVSGAFSLGILIAGGLGLVVGRLADRHGARALMAAGSVLAGFSLMALARVRQPWQFYVLWAGGIGLAMALTLYPVTFTVVANWFQRRRGRALAVLTLLGGLASPIFMPLAGWLVARYGWRATVVVLGLLQLVIALPMHAVVLRRHPEDLGLLPDGAQQRPSPGMATPSGATLRQALQRRAFWTLTAAAGLSLLAASTVLAHQIAYMAGRGYDPILAATLAGMVGVASLPGRFVFNVLGDRLGPKGLLALSFAFQGFGVVLLLLASSAAWLVAYVVVYGTAFGAVSPLRASLMAQHFGRLAYGAITAVQGMPVAVAAAIGPVVAGWLYDLLGNYQLALWLTALAFLLAALGVAVTPAAGELRNRGGEI